MLGDMIWWVHNARVSAVTAAKLGLPVVHNQQIQHDAGLGMVACDAAISITRMLSLAISGHDDVPIAQQLLHLGHQVQCTHHHESA